jgi:hypothetical protein
MPVHAKLSATSRQPTRQLQLLRQACAGKTYDRQCIMFHGRQQASPRQLGLHTKTTEHKNLSHMPELGRNWLPRAKEVSGAAKDWSARRRQLPPTCGDERRWAARHHAVSTCHRAPNSSRGAAHTGQHDRRRHPERPSSTPPTAHRPGLRRPAPEGDPCTPGRRLATGDHRTGFRGSSTYGRGGGSVHNMQDVCAYVASQLIIYYFVSLDIYL